MILSMLIVIVMFSFVWVSAQKVQKEGHPNIVLIMTDDQGYGDFSRHGNTMLRTPNMDKLALESIRFTDFHVASVCTPTRGQLLTGLDALRNGASSAHGQRHLLKRGLPTIGDILLSNGYRTALYGKWHLGGNFRDFMPHERGFEDAVWFLRGGVQSMPNYWNSDLMYDIQYHGKRGEQLVEQKQFPGYATDVWFDLGTRFVKESKKSGKPFFLYLPLNAPHAPLLVPDHYRAPYLHLNKETATFFGMITSVDHRLGEFVSMLEREGLRDNTILIFLTDNGTANRPDNAADEIQSEYYNAGMRGRKGSLYEGGHRVPLFISWPGGNLREPGDVDVLTHVQDILPTLIDLAGLEQHTDVQFDGISLSSLLHGESQPELDSRILVSQRNRHRTAGPHKGPATVMWRKWRLAGDELYNVEWDPGQEVNVSDRYPEIAGRLKEHYDRWWTGVEPHFDLERYRISNDYVTKLTAYDWWYGQRVYNWWHLRRGDKSMGRYKILVDKSGEYHLTLRRWPRESGAGIREGVPRYVPFDNFRAFDTFPPGEAINVAQARVRIGNQEKSIQVSDEDQEVTFTFQLPKGKTDLQTWFITEEGEEFGAYYVYVGGLSEF